jgi:hypothetical protein
MKPDRTRARFDDERGVVAVMVALLMVVMVGSAAFVFDLSRLRHERHLIQAAVDLGSLAGAAYLPVSDPPGAAQAEATARGVAEKNAGALVGSGLAIDFACVVSDPEGNGGQDSGDLAFACGPAAGAGTWTGGWTSRGGKALHICNPYAGDLCNTIKLTASSIVEYWFAPIMGINEGNTGAVAAAACKGFCGQSSSPLDVVFVIDRTGSMSNADIANVKDAIVDTSAAEDSVLEFYDPDDVYIGLVALPYKSATDPCAVDKRQNYPAPVPPNQALWQLNGFSNDYRTAAGNINPLSTLVQRIQCMQHADGTVLSYVPGGPRGGSGLHTNHAEAIQAAQALLSQGRPEAPDVIIFFADGQANQPTPAMQPCQYADASSTVAKTSGTTVFALGYGVDTTRCAQDTSASSPFRGRYGTYFLSQVASPYPSGLDSDDNAPGGCAIEENTDGDFYFCESRGEDLDTVFRQIAVQSIQRSRLLNF